MGIAALGSGAPQRNTAQLAAPIPLLTRGQCSPSEEVGRQRKIRIVLDGLRGEMSVAELCRREGIAANL
ncbi:MAG: hypothetical protein EX268_17440 [Deltaproteobacteria bacterium]|nr:MAG: hypothetical protein EX268_17440 [Deltaproteobacteria bacterium]